MAKWLECTLHFQLVGDQIMRSSAAMLKDN